MTRWRHMDGQGSIAVEPDGRVRMFVNDELADVFEAEARAGKSPDDVINELIDRAQASQIAAGTGPIERVYEEPIPNYS